MKSKTVKTVVIVLQVTMLLIALLGAAEAGQIINLVPLNILGWAMIAIIPVVFIFAIIADIKHREEMDEALKQAEEKQNETIKEDAEGYGEYLLDCLDLDESVKEAIRITAVGTWIVASDYALNNYKKFR